MSYNRVASNEQDADVMDDALDEDEQRGLLQRPAAASASSSSAAPSSAPASQSAPATSSSSAVAAAPRSASAGLLAWILSTLSLRGGADETPHSIARRFADSLTARYGPHVPALEALTHAEALAVGARQGRLVLLYLHSPLHGDTEPFLRTCLCTVDAKQAAADLGIVVWGGDVGTADGYEAAQKLRVTGFPFLGLYDAARTTSSSSSNSSSSGGASRTQYVERWRSEGLLTSRELVASLRHIGGALQGQRDAQRAQEMALEEERGWQRDQERDYAEAMARDLEQERERQERERREAEERKKEEEDRVRREDEEELERALAMSMELDREGMLDVCRRRLAANPPPDKPVPGSPPPASPEETVITVRLRLKTGKQLERRFRGGDTLALVRDFVVVGSAEAAAAAAGGPQASPSLGPTASPGSSSASLSASSGPAPFSLAFNLVQSLPPKKVLRTHPSDSPDLALQLKDALKEGARLPAQVVLLVEDVD